MAHTALEGGDIGPRENRVALPVGAHAPLRHLVQYAGVLKFQFHAAEVVILDGLEGVFKGVSAFVLIIPVPVGLHPNLVEA